MPRIKYACVIHENNHISSVFSMITFSLIFALFSIRKGCDKGCSRCLSRKQCLSCAQGYLLYNNSCLVSCPQGTYVDELLCSPCKIENCAACDSNTGMICSVCKKKFYLDNSGTC